MAECLPESPDSSTSSGWSCSAGSLSSRSAPGSSALPSRSSPRATRTWTPVSRLAPRAGDSRLDDVLRERDTARQRAGARRRDPGGGDHPGEEGAQDRARALAARRRRGRDPDVRPQTRLRARATVLPRPARDREHVLVPQRPRLGVARRLRDDRLHRGAPRRHEAAAGRDPRGSRGARLPDRIQPPLPRRALPERRASPGSAWGSPGSPSASCCCTCACG